MLDLSNRFETVIARAKALRPLRKDDQEPAPTEETELQRLRRENKLLGRALRVLSGGEDAAQQQATVNKTDKTVRMDAAEFAIRNPNAHQARTRTGLTLW